MTTTPDPPLSTGQPTPSLPDTLAIVTGASRGIGRGVSAALVRGGAEVIGVARDLRALELVAADLGPRFVPLAGDAADASLAEELLRARRPTLVVLAAGAAPVMQPLQDQTWDSFSRNWAVDVQQVFHWTRHALRQPLAPGSAVIAFSSGAALNGSPLSGGYAGANATIRFITGYAAQESARAGLGLRFTCVLPKLTPSTDLGAAAVAAYAQRSGVDVATFLESLGPTSTPENLAQDVVTLALEPAYNEPAYVLRPGGGIVSLANG